MRTVQAKVAQVFCADVALARFFPELASEGSDRTPFFTYAPRQVMKHAKHQSKLVEAAGLSGSAGWSKFGLLIVAVKAQNQGRMKLKAILLAAVCVVCVAADAQVLDLFKRSGTTISDTSPHLFTGPDSEIKGGGRTVQIKPR